MPKKASKVSKATTNGHATNGQIPPATPRLPRTATQNEIRENLMAMAHNIHSSRWGYLESMMDPRRNIEQECGYDQLNVHDPKEYRRLFDQDPIASRVVKLFPMETWGLPPEIYESEDPKAKTPFEQAWMELGANMGGDNWHDDQDCTVIWETLRRADIACGIGHFGIILLGFNDTPDLKEPVEGIDENGISSIAVRKKSGVVANAKPLRKLLYMRVFDESQVTISHYEDNPRNPRYGQPVVYSINFVDIENQMSGGATLAVGTKEVHWTRVIHVVDNVLSSEVMGIPRCKPVLHRILDLRKLYGGSAEMYWKGAFPGLSIETQPQLQGDVEIDAEAMRQQMFDYMNSLQRYLTLTGMSAKTLAPTVADPTAQINVQLEAISIEINVPMRILKGSERGELASSQDAAAWIDRVKDRQRMVTTPRLLVPTINRLIQVGCLPMPKRYVTAWPDMAALSEEEQARVGGLVVDVMTKYIAGGLEVLMTPMDFMMRILHYSQDEAEGILEAAITAAEEEQSLTLPPEPQMGPDGQPLPVGPDGQPIPAGPPVDEEGNPVDENGEPVDPEEAKAMEELAALEAEAAALEGGVKPLPGGRPQPGKPPIKPLVKKKKPVPAFSKNQAVSNDGEWITIKGTHVQIGEDGSVSKGPAALKGVISKKSGDSRKGKSEFDKASARQDRKEKKYDKEDAKKAAKDDDVIAADKWEEEKGPDAVDDIRGQIEAMTKRVEALKDGKIKGSEGKEKLTPAGLGHVVGKHIRAGATKAGAMAKALPGLIGTKVLGKSDFEAIKGIPKDLKERFGNLFKKGKFATNQAVVLDPITFNALRELGLVYNAFCPTGPGGGMDNSCGSGGGGALEREAEKQAMAEMKITRKDLLKGGRLVQDFRKHKERVLKELEAGDLQYTGGMSVGQKYADHKTGSMGPATPEDEAEEFTPYRKDTKAHEGFVQGYVSRVRELRGGGELSGNAFCPTGPGGGQDNTCPPGKGGGGSKASGIEKEPKTAPPPGKDYNPNVEEKGEHGVTKAARVGVDAMTLPPPPSVGKLPNLTPIEREVETNFREAFENDPDGVADKFRDLVTASTKPGEPKTFGTDDAKALTDVWSHEDQDQRAENRASLNAPLHQTANAIAKRAFVRELNDLKPGDEILVTVGGCGAGKGYALKNVPEALAMKQSSKIIWDSAGDQNATENPWIQKEAEARGLKVNYVYVHADPYKAWADPERGAIQRAKDPKDGRMVDAKVFADSYALGIKNHAAFYEKFKDSENAKFTFLDNRTKPSLMDMIPDEGLNIDRHALSKFAVDAVHKSDAPGRVKRGALIGQRIWAGDNI